MEDFFIFRLYVKPAFSLQYHLISVKVRKLWLLSQVLQLDETVFYICKILMLTGGEKWETWYAPFCCDGYTILIS